MEICPECSSRNVEVLEQYEGGVSVVRTRRCRDCRAVYIPRASPILYFWVLPLGLALMALAVLIAYSYVAETSTPWWDQPLLFWGLMIGFFGFGCCVAAEGFLIITAKSGRVIQGGRRQPPGASP